MAYNLALVNPFNAKESADYDEISRSWLDAWKEKSKRIMQTTPSVSDSKNSSPSFKEDGIKRLRDDDTEENEHPRKTQKKTAAIISKYVSKGCLMRGGSAAEELVSFIKTLIGDRDRIYVLGHCEPGSSMLMSSEEKGKGQTVSASELAKFFDLVAGLNKNYAGKIKIFGCHSALGLDNEKSFAEQFKDAMRKREYHNCSIEGYTASVRGYDGEHKVAFIGTAEELKQAQMAEILFAEEKISKSKLDSFYENKTTRPSTRRQSFT